MVVSLLVPVPPTLPRPIVTALQQCLFVVFSSSSSFSEAELSSLQHKSPKNTKHLSETRLLWSQRARKQNAWRANLNFSEAHLYVRKERVHVLI